MLKDRGQTLRFYRPNQIRMRADNLRDFLKTERWQHNPPWTSAFAPGGKRYVLTPLIICSMFLMTCSASS